tara:strand:- start:551 stop:781 length:231 start_codon:yes stop_codon:yes gene_type:complete
MCTTVVCRSATVRVYFCDFNTVFFNHAVFPLVMQMAIVEIVSVAIVLYRGMAAIGTVLMIVIFVLVVHRFLLNKTL